MDIDGLWALELGTNLGITEAGVIIFRYGRLIGGDSNHFYNGKYTLVGADQIQGELEITNYKENFIQIFGREKQYTLHLSGHFHIIESSKNQKPQMVIDSYLDSNKDQLVRLICEKQSALPW